MLALENIKNLHLEITSLCNARCPLCVRNANGFPHNFGYPETSLSLAQIKSLFSVDFVKQLTSIDYCGNFGDFVMNPEALEIAEYFQLNNPNMVTRISTNGSARNKQFWQALGRMGHNVHITFCIDGLEDTHSLYRVDTNWKNIIRNAQDFIEGGGTAVWKMIKFDHNVHQVDACRALALELGFHRFDFTDHGRNSGPVFDREGNLQYLLGDAIPVPFGQHADPANKPTVESVIEWHKHAPFKMPEEKNTIKCFSKTEKSIYIAADGSVYPCCYLGAYPTTFSNGAWYNQTHGQIRDLMPLNNNALEVGLEAALAWFDSVANSWNKTKYDDGRLILCDAHCGTNYQKWDRKTLE